MEFKSITPPLDPEAFLPVKDMLRLSGLRQYRESDPSRGLFRKGLQSHQRTSDV